MIEQSLLPITSLLTAVLLIFLVILSVRVTARRAVLGGIQFGDNDDQVLRSRIRAHGNFIEIAPFVIVAVGLMEYAGAPVVLLTWFSVIFLLGRFLHLARMAIGNPFIGLFSIISQHVICLWAGVWLLNHYFF